MQSLEDKAVQQLRACTQIAGFSTAVRALVLNAVEAGASQILVEVKAIQHSATVTDNGHGICVDSMRLLGVPCCSSKLHGRGDALASLAQISVLNVSSRAKGCFETYHKQICPSHSLQVAEPPHPSRARVSSSISLCPIPRSSHGTTVELSNFLFNQPVRRKRADSGVDATLQEVKAALHALMLPFTGVELILQQGGSKAILLHMRKERSLPDTCRQLFWQHLNHLYTFSKSDDTTDWNITGAVAAPPAHFNHSELQLLYVNSRAATCPILQTMLKDWFTRSFRLLQTAEHHTTGTRMHIMRTPEPGYVLCISCPAAAVVYMGRNLQQQIEVGFSNSNLTQLSDLLQQACASAWGEMPSSWKKATASTAKDEGQHAQMAAGQHQDRVALSICPGVPQLAQQLKPAPVLLPVHGLQLSSVSRSLACIKVQSKSVPPKSFISIKLALPRPPLASTEKLEHASMQQMALFNQDIRRQQQQLHLQDIELHQNPTQAITPGCHWLSADNDTQIGSALMQQRRPATRSRITGTGEAAAAEHCGTQACQQSPFVQPGHLQVPEDVAELTQDEAGRDVQHKAARAEDDDIDDEDWCQADAPTNAGGAVAALDTLPSHGVRAAGHKQYNLTAADHYGQAQATDCLFDGCPATSPWSPCQQAPISPGVMELPSQSPQLLIRQLGASQDGLLCNELYGHQGPRHRQQQGWLLQDCGQTDQQGSAAPLQAGCLGEAFAHPQEQAGRYSIIGMAEPGMRACSFSDGVVGADDFRAVGWQQVGTVEAAEAAAAGTAGAAEYADEAPACSLHEGDWQQQEFPWESEGRLQGLEDEMPLPPRTCHEFKSFTGINTQQEQCLPLFLQDQRQHSPQRWQQQRQDRGRQYCSGQDPPMTEHTWHHQQHNQMLYLQEPTDDVGEQGDLHQQCRHSADTRQQLPVWTQAPQPLSVVAGGHEEVMAHRQLLHWEQLQHQQGRPTRGPGPCRAFAGDDDGDSPWLDWPTNSPAHDQLHLGLQYGSIQDPEVLVPGSSPQQLRGYSGGLFYKQNAAQPHSSPSGSIFQHEMRQLMSINSAPNQGATIDAHWEAIQTGQPNASTRTLDDELVMSADYDAPVNSPSGPCIGAKMVVDIKQQKPTSSEETVQEMGGKPEQQDDSRCQAHQCERGQQGRTGVLAEEATAPGSSASPSNLHDSSPSRPLPVIHLVLFKQRLCHSAPPAAKPACKLASSSCALTADPHSNRALLHPSGINRCLVYETADAPGPSATDTSSGCHQVTTHSALHAGPDSANIPDSCNIKVGSNGQSGDADGTGKGADTFKISSKCMGGSCSKGTGEGPPGAGSGGGRGRNNTNNCVMPSSLRPVLGSRHPVVVKQTEAGCATHTAAASSAVIVPTKAAGAAVPAANVEEPEQMRTSVGSRKVPKRRQSSPGALLSSDVQQLLQCPQPSQKSEVAKLNDGKPASNSKHLSAVAAITAGSGIEQQPEVEDAPLLPEGVSSAGRGRQGQQSKLAETQSMKCSMIQPAWLQQQSQRKCSRRKQLQQTKLAFVPVQISTGTEAKDTPACTSGPASKASQGQCSAEAPPAGGAAVVSSCTAAAAVTPEAAPVAASAAASGAAAAAAAAASGAAAAAAAASGAAAAAATAAAADATEPKAALRQKAGSAAEEKQKPLKPALKREPATKLRSSAASAASCPALTSIAAATYVFGGMPVPCTAMISQQQQPQGVPPVSGETRLAKRVRFSVGNEADLQQPGITTTSATCQLPQLRSEVHATAPTLGQPEDQPRHCGVLQQPHAAQGTAGRAGHCRISAVSSLKAGAGPSTTTQGTAGTIFAVSSSEAVAAPSVTKQGAKGSCSSEARCTSRFWPSESTKADSHPTIFASRRGSHDPAILSVEELQSQQLKGAVPLLVPASITRQQLEAAGVMDQVDKKILVAACGNILLAVDQHAADERVQLEALQQQLSDELLHQQQQAALAAARASSDQTSHCYPPHLPQQQKDQQLLLQHKRMMPPQQLHLTMAEEQAWLMHGQVIQSWGWVLKRAHSSSATASSAVSSHCDPAAAAGVDRINAEGPVLKTESERAEPAGALARAAAAGVTSWMLLHQVPVFAGVQLGVLDLQLYLHQLLETGGNDSSSHASSSSSHHGPLPAGVLRVLRSKACRTAVMFNTQLSWSYCDKLLRQLAATQLCFCCAHGRPTTVPLVDLFALHHLKAQKQQAGLLAAMVAAAEATALGGNEGQSHRLSLPCDVESSVRAQQQLERRFSHCKPPQSNAIASKIRLMLQQHTRH
eukprot:gene4629-biopygen6383